MFWSYLLRSIAPLFYAGLLFCSLVRIQPCKNMRGDALNPLRPIQCGTLLWTWMYKGMSLINRHVYIICIMTLFLFPLPFLCPLSFNIDLALAVRGHLQDQDLDENIIARSMENLKYIVAIDSVKSLFPYLRKELK